MIVPIFHIVSFKRKVGKTALLERLIRELRLQGFKVVAAKHTIHERLDLEDRDTHRLKSAGAECVIGISRKEVAVLFEGLKLVDVLERVGVDRGLILIEGFKSGPGYKLLVVDEEEVDVSGVENLIALLVKRRNLVKRKSINGVKVLDYYDTNQIVNFIKRVALDHIINKLPRLNCGMCGRDTCEEFVLDFLRGNVSISDCQRLRSKRVKLTVDGSDVPLSRYPSSVFERVILALVSTLKGVPEKPKRILLEIDEDVE